MKTRIKNVVELGRERDPGRLLSRRFLLLVTISLGAALGLLEMAVSWLWKTQQWKWRSAVLAGAGALVMALALGLFNRALVVFAVALAAVAGREFGLLALGQPPFCQANASLGLLLNGACLAGGVWLARGRLFSGRLRRAVVAGAAMLVSGGAFFLIGRTVRPCRDLLAFNYNGHLAAYLLQKAAPMALLAAVAFPLAYELGKALAGRLTPLWLNHRLRVSWVAGAVTLGFWLASLPLLAALR